MPLGDVVEREVAHLAFDPGPIEADRPVRVIPVPPRPGR